MEVREGLKEMEERWKRDGREMEERGSREVLSML
jgi:hypothetical protein